MSGMAGQEGLDICENRHGGNEASRAAHRKNRVSAASQRAWVLHIARSRGPYGVTTDELCEMASDSCGHSVTPNRISGRVSELVADRELVRTGRKRETTTGSQAFVHILPEFIGASQPERPGSLFDERA